MEFHTFHQHSIRNLSEVPEQIIKKPINFRIIFYETNQENCGMGAGDTISFCFVVLFFLWVKSGQRTDLMAFTAFLIALKQPKLNFFY